jgi:hypothetical protein
MTESAKSIGGFQKHCHCAVVGRPAVDLAQAGPVNDPGSAKKVNDPNKMIAAFDSD